MVRGGVRIIYSRLGERADDVIKRIISQERREWIVVSSDREIMHHAWSVGAVPVPSPVFYGIVERQVKRRGVPADSPEEEGGADGSLFRAADDSEDEEGPGARKGNPHQLSKKEKAVRKVLGKL